MGAHPAQQACVPAPLHPAAPHSLLLRSRCENTQKVTGPVLESARGAAWALLQRLALLSVTTGHSTKTLVRCRANSLLAPGIFLASFLFFFFFIFY